MLRNLLIYRLLIVNTLGLAGLVLAYQRGLIDILLRNDTTGITYGIIVLFAFGLVSVFMRGVKISRKMNVVKNGGKVTVNGPKTMAKLEFVNDIVGFLMLLGLLGTFIGIGIAIYGIDTEKLSSASGAQQVGAQLIGGVWVALGTTISGSVLGGFLGISYRMVRTATICLVEDAK